jgi:hypothetical protein
MMSPNTRPLWLLVPLGLAAACARPPEQRAFESCRAEIARRLVDPVSARYVQLRVERRSGDGASVVDGWDVRVAVEARAGDKKTARSSVLCTLGTRFELLDLSGEQQQE